MYSVISPSDRPVQAPVPTRPTVHGAAEVSFQSVDGQVRLADLYHRDPLRVLFPMPAAGDPPTAALVTVSGGMVGGDRLDVRAVAGAGAQALVTAQAAEKIYRSSGHDCRIEVALKAEKDSWLEWLPQETILFEGARLRRRTAAEVAPTGRLLAGEIVVLGRHAMGERMTRGLLREDWELRVGGRLVWADALRLDGDIAAVSGHPAGLGGTGAFATAVHAGADAAGHLETAREILAGAEGVRCGATVVNDVLVVRWLGAEAHLVRRSFGAFWAAFRHAVAGLPARLPRLWHI